MFIIRSFYKIYVLMVVVSVQPITHFNLTLTVYLFVSLIQIYDYQGS